jgi:DNA-binding response OmpR family regulator
VPRKLRILALDADAPFVDSVERAARYEGWTLLRGEVPVPVNQISEMKVDVVLIDPTSIGDSDWTYLELLIGQGGTRLLVCSARVPRQRRVDSLRRGIDDWQTKPINPLEITARLEAVVRGRRDASSLLGGVIEFRGLVMRPDRREAVFGGRPLTLTRREFDLLAVLVEAEGGVVERERLYQRVWGYKMVHGDRSVDVFVRKVRRKLGQASASGPLIHTHFGIGYRFEPES